ncbi:cation:proton antiporter [Sphingomonas sp.]|uniref:cation:proton antiporter domain-containing protein n=1 Tax=Sphingomonas sp. TaxID=28214 RepID=UPI00286D3A82|nr:cation:proton antiporter [Sphingomonas sp.]
MSDPQSTAHATTALLEASAILLGAGLIFALLFRKLKLGATLGYIVGGAVIGPYAMGLVEEPERLSGLTEIGIALLLFIVGLELDPGRLWRLRKNIFGLGLAQVVLSGLALSGFIYLVFEPSWQAALAIGLPLALSSTAQILPMLRSSGLLNTPRGERAFSILLFQDLSIVPLITIVAALSRVNPDPSAPSGLTLALYTIAAVVGLVVAGRFLLGPLFRLVGRIAEQELFVFAGLFVVVGVSALMHFFGLSVALGAFVAGVMLAESPYRHELESDIEPFRSLLLGMFFLSVGMLLDLTVIANRPLTVIGIAVGMVVIKALVLMLVSRAFRVPWHRSIRLGLLLSQAGEFGFVLFAQAAAGQLLTTDAAAMFSAVVVLSMATTPLLMRLTGALDRYEEKRTDLDGPEKSPVTPVIMVGYGRFGQTVGQMLMAKGFGVTIIDLDAEMIDVSGEFGWKVYYGDGTRIDLLRTAGAADARAILFCNDGDSLNRESLTRVLEAFPQASIMARVFDRRQLIDLRGLDLAYAQRELFESAVKVGRKALAELGIEAEEIDRVESAYRLRDCERLERQREAGDYRAGQDQIFAENRALADPEDKAGL